MNLYKRPNSPFWWYDQTISGKRRRVSTKRTVKREAEAVATSQISAALDQHQLGRVPELTLRAALFEKYLPLCVNMASYVNIERSCRALVGDRKDVKGLGWGGDMPFHEIDEDMMNTYRVARRAQGKAEQTVDHEIKVISAAYHKIASKYRVRAGLKFPVSRVKGKPRPLLATEVEALLADLDPARPIKGRGDTTYLIRPIARTQLQRVDNYDLVVMLLDTGARFGEIAHLTWDFIDTQEFASIKIFRSKVDKIGLLATTSRMRGVLRRRFAARTNSRYVFPGWAEEDAKGDELPRSGTKAIRMAMKRIGVNAPDKVRVYGRRDVRSLRDTFATTLRGKGMSLDRLQLLLGHSSPQMTQKYADYSVAEASNEAVALLDQMAS